MAEVGAGGLGGGSEGKVRVVKCPKCEKLLPELADFTVYKCGGCNATLQAKKQIPGVKISSGKSDKEKLKIFDNLETSLNMKRVGSDGVPKTDCEIDPLKCRREEVLGLDKSVDAVGASVCRSVSVKGLNEPREKENIRSEPVKLKVSKSRDTMYVRPSKAPATNLKLNVNELEINGLSELPNGHHEAPQGQFWKGEVRNRLQSSREDINFAPYLDGGPSNSYSEQNLGELSQQLNLGQDPGELLRKLDELRDQLRQSCGITEKIRERTPSKETMSSSPHGNCGNDACFAHYTAAQNGMSHQHAPSFNGHSVYQVMHPQSGIPGYREPFGSQPVGVAPFHSHVQYPQRPINNYSYGQMGPDHVSSYHHDGLYQQPACSCFHCCNRQWSLPARAPPAIFSGQRAPCIVNNHGLYPVENPMMFGRQSYNRSAPCASLHSHALQMNKRVIITKEGRSCEPIGGAAPFVICCSCSKVLELPRKLMQVKKDQFKLRCGSCFQVMSVELDGQRLTTTAPVQTIQAPSEPSTSSSIEMTESSHFHDHIDQYPDRDFNSPIYNVHYTDEKLGLPSFSNSSSDMLEKVQGLSFSSSTSEDVESPNNMNCQLELPSYTELPLEVEVSSNVSAPPLCENFGHSSSNHVNNGPGKGSKSSRSVEEKIVSANGNAKQNPLNVPVVSEMDLSVDDYPNLGSSQDSSDLGKDEDQTKFTKGGESFFTGIIKKSIKEFRSNQSMENSRFKVTINGHPLSDRLVKKAEKQAGPIHPGDYWYDYRAGFWGVMEHPCLGIIPPFIEEFNYPMSRNCAGGNTNVLVNGRELHQKDLDLLVGRGFLPTEGQSYIIDISGKVWDEATGEELDGLGKLAPTNP
ncbi:hypothetical protein J5N97_028099 [Dioscorea zingiberensis]|uniref:Zinc-ribbon domain-containing protein n=1 Tax=Dioscorea zingiberensis TaxID=325984 RepID=A0A9D5BXX1_9LILI|nr:hypothetical protein J5N97_028099 [Dioscorea zingiberensis]